MISKTGRLSSNWVTQKHLPTNHVHFHRTPNQLHQTHFLSTQNLQNSIMLRSIPVTNKKFKSSFMRKIHIWIDHHIEKFFEEITTIRCCLSSSARAPASFFCFSPLKPYLPKTIFQLFFRKNSILDGTGIDEKFGAYMYQYAQGLEIIRAGSAGFVFFFLKAKT